MSDSNNTKDSDNTINVKTYFDDSQVDLNSIKDILNDFLEDEEFLNSEDNVGVQNKLQTDQTNQLVLSEEEREIALYLIAETVFTVNLIVSLDDKAQLDFSGLLPIYEKEDLLMIDIKSRLINDLLDLTVEGINNLENIEDYDIPKNYDDMVYQRIEQYMMI